MTPAPGWDVPRDYYAPDDNDQEDDIDMTYDSWKTTEPDEPDEWMTCDHCGKRKPLSRMQVVWAPGDNATWVCDDCLDITPEPGGYHDLWTLDTLEQELCDR